MPKDERKQLSEKNQILRTFAKITGPTAGFAAAGYGLTELTQGYSVEDFIELIPASPGYIGSDDLGDLASEYGMDLMSYGMDHAGEAAQYTQEVLNSLG